MQSHILTGDAFEADKRTDKVYGVPIRTPQMQVMPDENEFHESKCNTVSLLKADNVVGDCRNLLAVTDNYICYSVRKNLLRIIHTVSSEKTLLRGHADAVADMQFSMAGNIMCSTDEGDSDEYHTFMWKLTESAELSASILGMLRLKGNIVQPHPNRTNVFALTSGQAGKIGIICSDFSGDVTGYDSLPCNISLPSDQTITDISFSPDGNFLVAAILPGGAGSIADKGPFTKLCIWNVSDVTSPPVLHAELSVPYTLAVKYIDGAVVTASKLNSPRADADAFYILLQVWHVPSDRNEGMSLKPLQTITLQLPAWAPSGDTTYGDFGEVNPLLEYSLCADAPDPKYVVLSHRRSNVVVCLAVNKASSIMPLYHATMCDLKAPVESIGCTLITGKDHHSAEEMEHLELACYQPHTGNQAAVQQFHVPLNALAPPPPAGDSLAVVDAAFATLPVVKSPPVPTPPTPVTVSAPAPSSLPASSASINGGMSILSMIKSAKSSGTPPPTATATATSPPAAAAAPNSSKKDTLMSLLKTNTATASPVTGEPPAVSKDKEISLASMSNKETDALKAAMDAARAAKAGDAPEAVASLSQNRQKMNAADKPQKQEQQSKLQLNVSSTLTAGSNSGSRPSSPMFTPIKAGDLQMLVETVNEIKSMMQGDPRVSGNGKASNLLSGSPQHDPSNTQALLLAQSQAQAQAFKALREDIGSQIKSEVGAAFRESNGAVEKNLGAVVKAAVAEASAQTVQQTANSLKKVIEAETKKAVDSATKSKSFYDELSRNVGDRLKADVGSTLSKQVKMSVEDAVMQTVRTSLAASFRQAFESSLLPSFQAGTERMFAQVQGAFEEGMGGLMQQGMSVQALNVRTNEELTAEIQSLKGTVATLEHKIDTLSKQAAAGALAAKGAGGEEGAPGTPPLADPHALLEQGLVSESVECALEYKDVVVLVNLLAKFSGPGQLTSHSSDLVQLCTVQQLAIDFAEHHPVEGVAARLDWLKSLVMALMFSAPNSESSQHLGPVLSGVLDNLRSAEARVEGQLAEGSADVSMSVLTDLKMLITIMHTKYS